MKKNLLLYILLGFLVVVNGFFLFKQFDISNQKRPKRPGPRNFIGEQLEFDAVQSQQFEKLDVVHRQNMNAILNEIRLSKDALFDNLSHEKIDDSQIDSITTQIANKEKTKELETFRFFKAVDEICNEKQKILFKTIIKDALRRQGPQGQNGPPLGRSGEEDRPPPPGGPGNEDRPPPPRD